MSADRHPTLRVAEQVTVTHAITLRLREKATLGDWHRELARARGLGVPDDAAVVVQDHRPGTHVYLSWDTDSRSPRLRGVRSRVEESIRAAVEAVRRVRR
jgi:hypothetical protein